MRTALISLALILAASSVSAQTRVLRWAHAYKPTETYHLQAVEAGNEIARLTSGRIKIDVYAESKLGGEETYGAKLSSGELDIAYYGTNQAGRDFPRIGISGYPFIFQDTDHVAQENPLPTIMAQKFYEVQKYTFLIQHIHELTSVTIGGSTWKSLSPADQKIVDAAIKKAAMWASAQTISNELVMETELRKNGMALLPVDRRAFREAVLRNSKPGDISQTQEDYGRVSALASRKP